MLDYEGDEVNRSRGKGALMASLFDHARAHPARAAIRFVGSETALDYRGLAERAADAAAWMLEIGLQPGEVVALLCENRPELLAFAFGARRCGLYFTPVSTHLKPRELSHILSDSQARVLVVSRQTSALAQEVLQGIEPPDLGCFHLEPPAQDAGFPAELRPARPARRVAEAELPPRPLGRDFLYSSGTTGLPRGIRKPLVPWAQRDSEDIEVATWRKTFDFGADSVYFSAAPLYHAAPLRYAMRTLEVGGSCVLMSRFDAEQALVALSTEQVTHSQWVPTMFVRLLELPQSVRARWTPRGMKRAIHAAAPCAIDVKRAMIDWWGPVVGEYYGGSEGLGLTAIDSHEWLAHPGSVGRAKIGTLHIVDDDGRELPPGEVGQVWFEGGPRFEYFGQPEKTAGAYDARGWASYGDLGHVDADGYLYLASRRADLILSGGVNVYPTEVEQVLCLHPMVEDAAVVGHADADMGQVVRAIVKLRPAAVADDGMRDALLAHCRALLSSIKVPRLLEFRDQLPRIESGKLLHRLLRDPPPPPPPLP